MALNEVWVHAQVGRGSYVARQAEEAEAEGFDGMMLPVVPTIVQDPWVCLALAAKVTDRMRFATGVTNPGPQIAAAMAGSAITLQQESDGRAVLGIGRGDSAGALLGMSPMPVKYFQRYVTRLQGFLAGEDVPFDLELDAGGIFPPVSELELAEAPRTSRMAFIDGAPKVPLDIFCSGPKIIAYGASIAERVTFAVGAEADRIAWAVDTARKAMADAGRDPSEVSLGAWLSILPHEDRELSRRLVTGAVASMARFTSMQGKIIAPVDDTDRDVYQGLHDKYTYSGHFTKESPQSKALTPEFIDKFALIGSVEEVTDRLEALVEAGLDRIAFSFPKLSRFTDPTVMNFSEEDAAEVAHSRKLVVEEVLPELRARVGSRCAAGS